LGKRGKGVTVLRVRNGEPFKRRAFGVLQPDAALLLQLIEQAIVGTGRLTFFAIVRGINWSNKAASGRSTPKAPPLRILSIT
jgi:hypothetical protein